MFLHCPLNSCSSNDCKNPEAMFSRGSILALVYLLLFLTGPVYASHVRQTTSSIAHKKQQVPVGTREKEEPLHSSLQPRAPLPQATAPPGRPCSPLTSRPDTGCLPSRQQPSPLACRPDERPRRRPAVQTSVPCRRPPVQARALAAGLPSRRAPPPPAPLGFRRPRIGCRPHLPNAATHDATMRPAPRGHFPIAVSPPPDGSLLP
jgi:hypothetical protein